MEEAVPRLAPHARGKRPQFYDTNGLDHAMSMILVLASELMVMRDRVDTVERIAADKGVFVGDEIDAYRPPQSVLDEREKRRQDFLERLYYVARKEASELENSDSAERYSEALEEIARR